MASHQVSSGGGGFFGVTPVTTQPAGSAQAQVTTTAPTSVAVGAYAFSQAQATDMLAQLAELRSVLVNWGLWKGSS